MEFSGFLCLVHPARITFVLGSAHRTNILETSRLIQHSTDEQEPSTTTIPERKQRGLTKVGRDRWTQEKVDS